MTEASALRALRDALGAECVREDEHARVDGEPLAPTLRPAAVEPVKEIMAMFGSAHIAWPTSAPPGSTCRQSFGRPASSNTRAMR